MGKIHLLDEIVFMSICGVLCGADSWQEIAEYSESKHDWLKNLPDLAGRDPVARYVPPRLLLARPAGLPEVFLRLDNRADESAWLDPIPLDRPELRPIAIDGKTQRGSARRTVGQSPLHMVSAWSVENHLTLGQVATHAKSNEITAIPELLKFWISKGPW